MFEFYETVLVAQIIFFTLQNAFEIRENSRARCEIYSKFTIKTEQ